MAMPARASTGFILPVLIEGDIIAVGYWRRKASWRLIAHMLPWAAIGIALGFFLLKVLSDAAFKPILGAMILAIAALDILRRATGSTFRAEGFILSASIGVLAGVFTMLANAAGPVMTIYLLSMGLGKEEFIGTGAWFYFIINLVKLPLSVALGLVTWASLGADLALTPLVIVGSVAGALAVRKLPQKAFDGLALALAIVGGARLLF
jgi:uncharacterized membrane protein YfcA